jgi:hypothetical protein
LTTIGLSFAFVGLLSRYAPLRASDEDIRRAEDLSFFETKIRPVLEASCKSCHGPKVAESDLRLDSAVALKTGGAVHGPAVVPGKPDESPLFQAISYKVEDLKMPPKPGPLSAEAVADFRRWIERGAVWPEESGAVGTVKRFDIAQRKSQLPWLWKAPARPELPAVKNAAWPKNDLDKFLLAKLESAGIAPAKDADDVAWLRRASFVLTGLPPAVADVDAFQADTSADKRAKAVDRLLASPAFGERWARHWMDLVRYAESRGHEGDYTIANAWRYRDYLIRAFNDDVPYDQFVREHLAGDLLDQPRTDPKTGANQSLLATGWPFLGEEVHSPVDIRQDETDRMDNKIDVLGKTFLGLTIACARCHDHKFDAISQKDYYALAGFFQSSTYRQAPFATMAADREIGRRLETLRAAKAAESRDLFAQTKAPSAADFEIAIGSTSDAEPGRSLRAIAADSRRLVEARQNSVAAQGSKVVRTIVDFESGENGGWHVDGPVFGSGPMKAGTLLPPNAAGQGLRVLSRAAAVVDAHFARPRTDPQSEGEAGSLGNWLRGSGTGRTRKFTIETGHLHLLATGQVRAFAAVASHYMVTGPLHGRVIREIKVEGDQPQWVHQDLSEYVGQRVTIEVTPAADAPGALFAIVETDGPQPPNTETAVGSSEPTPEALSKRLESALEAFGSAKPIDRPTAEAMDALVRHPAALPGLAERLAAFAKAWAEAEKTIAAEIVPQAPLAPTLGDLNGIDEQVLLRGSWRRLGPAARRGLPEAFSEDLSLSDSSSGRRELAERLTRPDQPLVARVWVNRLWQHVFGVGIVSTPDNFGMLGFRPSHPELLDHLAVAFVNEDGWSTKAALKRMLLSRAFGLSSHADDPAAEQADPQNVLLHRANLRRLEAEAIRDSMLAVSGRLDRTLYGPAIPVHLTEFIVGRGRPGTSGPLDGAGRRSIYTAVRRNFLPTLLSAFDLPAPFSAVGRRNETNVPAQALALANDPFVIGQARFWADRELRTHPHDSDEARIVRMFRTALARTPVDDEKAALADALTAYRQTRQGPDTARADAEAWADLAHTLFCINEFRYVP